MKVQSEGSVHTLYFTIGFRKSFLFHETAISVSNSAAHSQVTEPLLLGTFIAQFHMCLLSGTGGRTCCMTEQ